MCEGGGLGEWGGGIGTAVSEDQRDAVRPHMTSAVADRIEMSCFFKLDVSESVGAEQIDEG